MVLLPIQHGITSILLDLGSLISLFLLRIEGWLFLCSFSSARLARFFNTHYCVKPHYTLGIGSQYQPIYISKHPRFPDIYQGSRLYHSPSFWWWALLVTSSLEVLLSKLHISIQIFAQKFSRQAFTFLRMIQHGITSILLDLGSLISLFLLHKEGWLFLCSFSFARLKELFDTHYCVKGH